MAKIVTLTLNPALDKSTHVDKIAPESKLRCERMRIDPGGGGINVSKAIQKLGGESIAVFPVGGHNGLLLRKMMEDSGIQTDILEVEAETRESFSVTESTTNLQYRFTMPGEAITEAEADACLERIEAHQPEYLVASGSLPPGLPETYYRKLAAFARYINTKLILDTSGAALKAAAHEGLYMLKPNLGELSALAGVPKLEMNYVDDAAMQIIAQGMCSLVVVSMGPQGALVATKDGFEHIPAPMVRARTTVGAGDSMVAGMVWALAEGKSFREMAQIGVACGSAATLSGGTQLFDPKEVERLLKWIKTYGDRYRFTDF